MKWQYEQFLVYHGIELTLKTIYKLQRLIGGLLSHVWDNWLDNVIVITGICESWIALLLTDNTKFLAYLRALRLLWLARVLKIAHMMLTADISWAQGQWFQTFVFCAIGFNNRLLDLEWQH